MHAGLARPGFIFELLVNAQRIPCDRIDVCLGGRVVLVPLDPEADINSTVVPERCTDIATAEFTATGTLDIAVVKFDTNGNFLWAKQIGGFSEEALTDLVIDANGNLNLTARTGWPAASRAAVSTGLRPERRTSR